MFLHKIKSDLASFLAVAASLRWRSPLETRILRVRWMQSLEEDILRALRRLTRAIDLHSRRLVNTFGLTGPQLVCLRVLSELGRASASQLARRMSLSQGTVTGIVDRLEARKLIRRIRRADDRRVVTLDLTDSGRALVAEAPSPLQEQFTDRLRALPPEAQRTLLHSLDTIVEMMGGSKLEAAPVLSTSPAAQSSEEVRDVLAAGDPDVALVTDLAPASLAKPRRRSKPAGR